MSFFAFNNAPLCQFNLRLQKFVVIHINNEVGQMIMRLANFIAMFVLSMTQLFNLVG